MHFKSVKWHDWHTSAHLHGKTEIVPEEDFQGSIPSTKSCVIIMRSLWDLTLGERADMNHLRVSLQCFITFHDISCNGSFRECKFMKVCLCHGLIYFLPSGAPQLLILKVEKLISEDLHADSQAFPSWHLTGSSDQQKPPKSPKNRPCVSSHFSHS